MAKQLNINLAFTADTSQAQQNIANLNKSLNELSSIQPLKGMTLSKDMQSAVSSAQELKTHLANAFNTKTGNLDLSKLNASLKAANTDIGTLGSNLLKAGIQGEQAFMNVQRAIGTASVQIKQANGLLANFWTTLKNTARWQLSSSVLHGFMGAMQSAYGYAQDLNESLNNIRIVTGYNTDYMADFAEQANKAAKALSTTTTAYSDAALIFYQQGLSGEEVLKRADTVIKMANVTGEVASDVSNYMTAVWNNFYDGSKSLEYYSDVMTALGAATASSTDEIAAGLEKFAAVAETVGLSYEYATAALATVTAETRQSADIVGTAFKTLFARIQDLELGETLDDGTTLGSYSQSLAKVGINIMDTSGEMKKMDVILTEMAGKWDDLSAAQQTALAQSVAGVRQYTQLIALMDNWDSMEVNLGVANTAEGTLQSQAEIYEESWDAASKRVKASLEGLYNDLIPTDFIIDITDAIADIVSAFDTLVEGIGGLPNILLMISSIALSKMGPSMANGINLGIDKIKELKISLSNVSFLSTSTAKQIGQISTKMYEATSSSKGLEENIKYFDQNLSNGASQTLKMSQEMNQSALSAKNLTTAFEGYLNDTTKVYNLQGLIEQSKNKLTAAEREQLSAMQQETLELAAQKQNAQEKLDILLIQQDRLRSQTDISLYDNAGYDQIWTGDDTGTSSFTSEVVASEEKIASLNSQIQNLVPLAEQFGISFQNANGYIQATSNSVSGIEDAARESAIAYEDVLSVNDQISRVLTAQGITVEAQKKRIHQIINEAEEQGKISKDVAAQYRKQTEAISDQTKDSKELLTQSKGLRSEMDKTEKAIKGVASQLGVSDGHLGKIANGVKAIGDQQEIVDKAVAQYNISLDMTIQKFTDLASKGATIGGVLTKSLQGFSTVAMGINSISNAVSTLGDEGASMGQKLTATAMALTTGFAMVKTVIGGISGVISILNAKTIDSATASAAAVAAKKLEANAEGELAAKKSTNVLISGLANAQNKKEIVSVLTKVGVKNAEALAEQFLTIQKEKGTIAAIKATAANVGLAAAEYTVLQPLLIIAAVIATVVAAFAIWDAVTVSAAEKTERLTENIQNMKDAASEVKEEAEGLKDAFDEYQNVKTTLEECTVGTTEWKEAMEDVKAAIDEILEAYPELAAVANILKWDEGTQSYILDEDKVNNYIKDQEEAANAMSYGAQMAEGMLLENRASYSSADFKDEIALSNYASNYSNNGLNNLNASDLTGDEAKDREIIRNAIKNDVITGNLVDKEQFAARNEYGNLLYNEDGSLQLGDPEGYQAALDSYVDAQMEANSELIDSLFSIAETYREINGQAQTIYDNATKAKVSEKFAGQGLTEAEMNAAAVATKKDYDTIFTELYGTDGTGDAAMAKAFSQGQSSWNTLTDEGKAILTRYENAVGHTINWSDNLVQGNDANRTFHITGQDEGLTPEEIATTIAAYEALGGDEATENQQASMDIISDALVSANATGDSLITAITNGGDKEAMSNFLGQFTQTELETLMAGIDTTTGEIDTDTLSQLGLTPEQLSQVGEIFGLSAEQIGLALVDAGNTIQSFTEEQQAILDATIVDMSNATIGQQKAFAEARGNIGEYLTEESDGAISESVLGDIESENADNIEGLTKFYEGLGNIGLTAEDASEQIAALAEQYGIEGVAVDNLMTSVEGLDQVYSITTQNINDQAASLKEIVGEGLSVGDTISTEDLQVLEEAGINIDQYFTQMADGTYSLTGKADEFNAAVNRITFEGLKQQWEDFSKAEAQVLENYNSGAYNGKIRDTSSIQAGDASANKGYVYTEYGAGQLGKARLDYINSFDAGTFNFTEEQNKLLTDYTANPEMDLTAEQLETIAEMIDIVNAKSVEMEGQMFSTATSLSELNQIAAELTLTQEGGFYSLNAYGEGLINLASKYDNCETEIQDLQEAMMSGDEAMIKSKIDALELATTIGELSEKYGLDAEDVETHAKLIQENAKDMKLSAEQAANLAVANRRMNKGVATLNENWEDWSKILKSSNKNTVDYADTLNDAHEALADLVGAVDASAIPLDFLDSSTESGAQHLEWMEKAAQGDAQAINQLGVALTAAQVDLMEFDAIMAQTAIDGGYLDSAFNLTAFETYKTEILEGITALQTAIQDGTLVAGQNITDLMNGTGLSWVDSLNQMAMATGMSVEEMNGMLNQLGVQAKVDVVDVPQKMKIQGYSEQVHVTGTYDQQYFDVATNSIKTRSVPLYTKYTVPGETREVDGIVQVAQISTEDGGIGAPQINYTGTNGGSIGGGVSPSSTSHSGGGGSTPKAPDKAEKRDVSKKSDTVERYREVTDAIDNVTDALTRAERATDRLWGKDKLAAMREENKILEEQRDLILEKAKEAEEYAKEDASNLRKVADDIGVSVVINQETGDITNIEDVEETLYNRLAAAEAEYNAKVDAYNKYIASIGDSPSESQVEKAEAMKDAIDAYEEDIIGSIEDDISAWEDAEQQFQESVETWEDAGLEAEEILDQIMQNNYDIIMEGLEIPLSLNEEDLRLVELQLSQIEDDVYSMAEAVALTSSQFGEYQDNLHLADEALAELSRAHKAGEITDAAYQEGLGEIRDKYYENIEALMELDDTMMEYYSNTIDMANEELSKYTDQIEHQTSVLEHYSSLIELMGKSSDYKMMGKVLEGQVKTTKDAMIVSKQWYEAQRANADSLAAEYAAAQARGASEQELELIKANWDAAEASANEAQDKMLSDAEAWAEALKAVLENKLADLGQTLENALTGGTSFDTINTQMERAQSLQEEYLTTTNQIYETNKLMRTAQQEIDKTTNSVAKKKLQAYITETEQLQNQSKLSQYELEIQQAKYDLLLAEIALEEAQDAKSTVRLQRDSEGNFGYVYTADQNKLAEAQQQLEDAQNNLYNIGLEGANSYTEKYQQTMSEMYDTLTDLQSQYLDGAFESEEEYHAAMEAAKEYYYQKLQDYSTLYQISLTTDSRVIKDAWSTDFADMTYNTEQWMSNVDKYTDEVIQAFKDWQIAITAEDGVASIIGNSLEDVAGNVQDITDKSNELAKTTKDEVIPALDDEIDSVATLTGEYAKLRDTIQEIITKYGLMINTINNNQQNEYNTQNDNSNEETKSNSNTNSSGQNTENIENSTNTDSKSDIGNVPSATLSKGDIVKVKANATHFSKRSSNQPMQSWVPGSSFEVFSISGDEVLIGDRKRSGIYTGWVNKTDLEGFDTGGYTGEWGSYGKMAMLHEKELILNQHDTENFLASMEVLEKILAMIDLQSANAQIGGLLSSPGLIDHNNSVIEQNVHIEASFPGVSDRNEIEEAFNNLINKASQYANRK